MTLGGALVNSFAQLVITAPVTEHFPATRFFHIQQIRGAFTRGGNPGLRHPPGAQAAIANVTSSRLS
jgi:hypothetical protein